MFLQINFEFLENYLSVIEGTVWGQWRWVGLNTCVGRKVSLGYMTYTGMRRIRTFRSTTDRIYDGGPIII